jgi:serine protease inhibitor
MENLYSEFSLNTAIGVAVLAMNETKYLKNFCNEFDIPHNKKNIDHLVKKWTNLKYSNLDNINMVCSNMNFHKKNLKNIDNIEYKPVNIKLINDRVSEAKNGKIENLLKPDIDEDLIKLITVNILYLKAKWKNPFDPKLTDEKRFYEGNNSQAVFMVKKDFHIPCFNNSIFKMVEIPFQYDELVLGLLLPHEQNNFPEILDGKKIQYYRNYLDTTNIDVLEIPKLSISNELDLSEIKKFQKIFEDNPDIKGIQKVNLELDEEGVEASVATAIIEEECECCSLSDEPQNNFIANHPFFFYITPKKTTRLLFSGIYRN